MSEIATTRKRNAMIVGRQKTAAMLIVLGAFVLAGAEPSHSQQPTFRSEVDLVSLNVTVSDSHGVPIEGLSREQFHVREDDVEQQIRHFSDEDVPFTIGLVLDRSGSMVMVMDDVYRAALHTLEASKPDDESFVIVFNDRVELIQEFTSDRKVLERALKKVRAGGQTALYDAVYTAINHVRKGKYRKKALLVVTDGADNSSHTRYQELIDFAKAHEVLIHVIGLFGDMMQFGALLEDSPDADKLSRLAEVTGGRAYFPKTMAQCREACLDTARELRRQYSLAYYPSNRKKDGTWRKISIEVSGLPDRERYLRIRTRQGYFASNN